jgi:hypothetical protein
MKRKLLAAWLVLLFASSAVLAQVQIQGTLPAVGLVQKNQLWNLVLVNGTAQDMNGVVELTLRDRSTGLEMLTAVTSPFILKKGANTVNVNSFSPVQYNYTGMQPDNTLNGLLPAGSYSACYAYVYFQGEGSETLAQECFSFDIEALSPPMLIFPTDSSVLDVAPAQFSWIPPAPAALFPVLQYDYFLVEVREGQRASEAVQENLPIYHTANWGSNMLAYSATMPSLEKGKWYAWQVIARDGRQYAGKSETWVFSIRENASNNADSVRISYSMLSADGQQAPYIHISTNTLYLKHVSRVGGYEGQIQIHDALGKLVQQEQQRVEYGDNYLRIKLKNGITSGQVYTIELITPTGKRHKASFTLTAQNQK